MNEMMMKGKWHQTKGALKERWGKLTDNDIQMFLGEGEQLVGKLQERYGYSQQQAQHEVAKFMESLREDLSVTETKEWATEAVRDHPWLSGVFFGGMALLMMGYVVNRIFSFVEIREEVTEKTG